MTIDLSVNHIDIANYTYEYKLKSVRLLTALNRLNINMTKKYNYIIMPMSVYNIIECCDNFKSIKYDVDNISNLKKVGFLGDFECYLDIYLNKNEIIVSWDKATSRDVKINNLFLDQQESEKTIEVIF